MYAADGGVSLFCDAPPPPVPPMYTGVSVTGQTATVTFDRPVCRSGSLSLADWVVAVGSDTTTYDDLGTSIPDCNATSDNGVLSGLLVLAAAPPGGSEISVTLTTTGGAIYHDQAGVSVSAPQTHTAIAPFPDTTRPTITTATGDVGSTTITLGFSKDVYCSGFSFASDITITDNNPATQDPVVVAGGPNLCGVTPATADASFSFVINMALPASRAFTITVTAEFDEIQDVLGNDLPNPSEISFTTAAGDFILPTLIDTQLLSNVGTTDFGDLGDSFATTFSEVMTASPFGGINMQDQDGSVLFLPCGPVVQCTWNTAGTTVTVTMTALMAPPFSGTTPGLQLPANITSMNGFSDLQGNTPNILGSPDRLIDNEVVTGPFAPPTVTDSRMVNNVATTDFGDIGDAFSVTFSGSMNLNPIGQMQLQDQDGTVVVINCGTNTICTWNSLVTELTVIVNMPIAPPFTGSTPGVQIPMRIATMIGIASGTNGMVPDLAGSLDTLIDYEFP